jgi:hypothetical protein
MRPPSCRRFSHAAEPLQNNSTLTLINACSAPTSLPNNQGQSQFIEQLIAPIALCNAAICTDLLRYIAKQFDTDPDSRLQRANFIA